MSEACRLRRDERYGACADEDMLAGIIADSVQLDEEELRRRRAESIQNVKKTNGRISFKKRVRENWDDDEDDDAWQS